MPEFVDADGPEIAAPLQMMASHSTPAPVSRGVFVDADGPQMPGPRVAKGLKQAWEAGVQSSVWGLTVRNQLPDIVLNERDATLLEKVAQAIGQMGPDMPLMALGGAMGEVTGAAVGSKVPAIGTAIGATAGAGFGAFALPATIRTALIERYQRGEVTSAAEFLHRTGVVTAAGLKEGSVGTLSSLTGLATKMAMPVGTSLMSKLVAKTAPLGAEVATMTAVPRLIEGQLPEPSDFAVGAILVGGLHVAHQVPGRLMKIYEKTGKTPAEVVVDAKNDPTIRQDLMAPEAEKPTLGTGASNESLQADPTQGSRGSNEIVRGADAQAEGPGRAGSDPSLKMVLGALNDASNRGIPHIGDGAILGSVAGATPSRPMTDVTGEVTGRRLFITEYENGAFSDIRVATPGDSGQGPAHVVGTVKGNAFFIGSAHGEGVKGVGYDLYQNLGRYLQENYPDVQWVIGHAGGTKDNPTGIRRLRNSFDGTQWEGNWAGTPVQSMAVGPAPRVAPEVPRAYQALANKMAVHEAVPGLPETVAQELFGPPVPVAGEVKPTQVNYKYLNTSEQVNGALQKISELNLAEIQKQRRGEVPWEQTQAEAGKVIQNLLGSQELFQPREPGTPAGAAELLARKQMLEGAANDMAARAREFAEAGPNASPEQLADFLQSINRAALIQAEFLGARAEAGRALNILKETKTTAERVEAIQKLLTEFGDRPEALAEALKRADSPEGMLKLARDIHKATTMEKFIELWKASILSGPITNTRNFLSNVAFAALQPVVDVAAVATSPFFKGDKVHFTEPLARAIGDVQAVFDMSTIAQAWTALTVDSPNTKTQTRQAIEGTKGYVVRTPFRLLESMDVLFRTMNERGEVWAQSARMAAKEGLNPMTQEFRARVAELAANPPESVLDKAEVFGARSVFRAPMGKFGKAMNNLVQAAPILEFILPFRSTPLNVFKEMARMTPAAPMVAEWRADFAAGGAKAARAAAEVAVGSAFATGAMAMVFSNGITGAGDPDPNKRRTMAAAGWQPYSFKVGNKYYSYQTLQPVGTLLGMSADMGEMWQYMDAGEKEKAANVLGAAFANAVTNQTFLQGLSQTMAAFAHPDRGMPKFVQSLSASVVPGAAGQTAQLLDPYVREVSSIKEAIQNRIPGLREQLAPQRDPYGEPVASPDRVGGISPIVEKEMSQDKVRTEAARLNSIKDLGVDIKPAKAPKSIHLPDGGLGKIGKVDLDASQRDVFGDVAGHAAYQALDQMVNSPGWDYMPDVVKAKAYNMVFEKTRAFGQAAALTDAQRQKEIQRVIAEVGKKLKPSATP
jgi:hypothetical protein